MMRAPAYWIGMGMLVVVYVVVYSGFLWYADGLPYVVDNNETFSSLWHAYNFFHFDLSSSKGLADESFAYHAAAHPVVHTHQGNVPRLFAATIFALGATTAESQIAVTTFTVGLLAAVFAYAFFARIAGPLLATIYSLLLITDYILVAQWQVVTYRVWHFFFFFSALLCVHVFRRSRKWGAALTVMNFAFLFYYELVFVAFVTLASALYAVVYLWKRWRDLFGFWVSQAVGAAIAFGILLAQLTSYMGWQNVLTDFRITFLGRNYFSNVDDLVVRAMEFYDRHHIAFWYNLEDGSQFRTLKYFGGSLTYFEFQFHTPLLTTICLVLVFGLAMRVLGARWSSIRLQRGFAAASGASPRIDTPPKTDIVSAFVNQARKLPPLPSQVVNVLVLLSCYALAIMMLNGDQLFGILEPISLRCNATAIAVAGAMGLLTTLIGPSGWKPLWAPIRTGRESVVRTRLAIYLFAVALLIAVTPALYNQRYTASWMEIAEHTLSRPLCLVMFFASVVISCFVTFSSPMSVHWHRALMAARDIFVFVLVCLVAYTVTYLASPAYIYSGYRFRNAPFTIFFTTAVAALAVYVLAICIAGAWSKRASLSSPTQRISAAVDDGRSSDTGTTTVAAGVLCVVVLIAISIYWFRMQLFYVQVLPPDTYAFLRLLREPPFRGSTFVLNGYAAPVAASTHSWAYMDENLVRNVLVIDTTTKTLVLDDKYLWFADKHSNSAYRRPDYFLCVIGNSVHAMAEVARQRAHRGAGYAGCETHQIVKIARHRQVGGFSPEMELVAEDTEGPKRVGYERWAIVRLRWEKANAY